MPLSSGYSVLITDLKSAYDKAKTEGAKGTDVIPQQAEDVGNAIHKYMETAEVFTDVIVDPGQASNAPAALSNPVGTYSAPGTGSGLGTISFNPGDVSVLIDDIKTAYYKAKDEGAKGTNVIPDLAADMKAAIHKFALTANVSTSVTVNPGVVVAGYMTLAGTMPTPMPATTLVGSGEGEGSLS